MKKSTKFSIAIIMLSAFAGFFFLGVAASSFINFSFLDNSFISPFVSNNAKAKPLQQYSLANLKKRQYVASPITIEEILEENPNYTSYLFSYTTASKHMTGQINIPTIRAYAKKPKMILMLRGYLPAEDYETGMGTSSAANIFAKAKYVTIAPDFLGYASSDKESEDVWEARFVKPINVIELIKSIRNADYIIAEGLELSEEQTTSIKQLSKPLSLQEKESGSATADQIGEAKDTRSEVAIWAHSNGGQIALSVLEITGEAIPTTLWAPMVAPFPYSILYFGWDEADEGKEQRKWISIFEENYDVLDFSITNHTNKLTGPIQIQHGSADDQVLTNWVESLVEKIKENEASTAAQINYYSYPNADHNLQSVWNTAVQRDLQFFEKNF